MTRRNYVKSFKTRKLQKITAVIIIQYINKITFDRNINNLKTSIF
jgi:hypothetical protein